MSYQDFIPLDIAELYEIYNYKSAAEIVATGSPDEFNDLINGLRSFRITLDDIRKPGGNESDIPKKISTIFREKGWMETRIKGDLEITKVTSAPRRTRFDEEADENEVESESETLDKIEELKHKEGHVEKITRANFLDGHKVDYVKKRVAFDLEWNSKDQTFDRDLYAFRAFYECDLIDAAVLMTRSESLNPVFEKLGPELDKDGKPKLTKNGKEKLLKAKYGASTTWIGKLIYRIVAGRNGGCPILVLGITPKLISDLERLR